LEPRASGVARVDTLVKTKVPALVGQEITIDAADLAATEKLYPLVQRGIRGGFFPPNRSHFMCSKRYCAFWRAACGFRRRRTLFRREAERHSGLKSNTVGA
jgi:hypothetical protein